MIPTDKSGATRTAMANDSDDAIRALYPEGSYELVRHDLTRRTLAQRLVRSKTTVPHFYISADCDIGNLLALRSNLNQAAQDSADPLKLSVTDFMIKALALGLQQVPAANVTWTEAAMLHHQASDVGVAVAIPGGLVAPVLRNAEAKSVQQIAREMRDLAARAQNKRLKPEEYQGGSTTVSNLGAYGVRQALSIVIPPQATILAIGAGEDRVVARNKRVEIAKMVTASLSCDHRAMDGMTGAALLAAFRSMIEQPDILAG